MSCTKSTPAEPKRCASLEGWGGQHDIDEVILLADEVLLMSNRQEFGNGITSAIDFSMGIIREPDPKGDQFTWS